MMTTSELRMLLLDWDAIDGDGGPGTANDGRGAWHLFCHLAAAAAVVRLPDRGAAWVGILHSAAEERYIAAVSALRNGEHTVLPLRSPQATALLARGKLCAYLEGASRGHILNRDAIDPGDPDWDDRRQDYDQSVRSQRDGGPVWEMWTVSRDIRSSNRLGTSLIEAYAQLLGIFGGAFAAVVARGRIEPEYGHLRQMCAMIDAGFITRRQALADISAVAIPMDIERVLLSATPKAFARASHMLLGLRQQPCYFMYERKITSFASASLLRRLVRSIGGGPIRRG